MRPRPRRIGASTLKSRAVQAFLAPMALLLLPAFADAQVPQADVRVPPEGAVQELVLTDGSVLYGRVEETGDPFLFRLASGMEMRIALANVRTLKIAAGTMEEGEYWPEDPNRTRLFFGPTARTLPRGQGYFSVYELFFPFLGFAVTDNIILAGGTPLIWSDEEDGRLFWLAPKIKLLDTGTTQAAVGILAFFFTGESGSAGIFYASATRGSAKSALTGGIGWGYWEDEVAGTPTLLVGGEVRTGRHVKFVTENWIFPEEGALLSVGPRFFGERLSADVGLMMPVFGDGGFVFPLVNFVWNF